MDGGGGGGGGGCGGGDLGVGERVVWCGGRKEGSDGGAPVDLHGVVGGVGQTEMR